MVVKWEVWGGGWRRARTLFEEVEEQGDGLDEVVLEVLRVEIDVVDELQQALACRHTHGQIAVLHKGENDAAICDPSPRSQAANHHLLRVSQGDGTAGSDLIVQHYPCLLTQAPGG